jgi:predicted transcriptional regulator YdeE
MEKLELREEIQLICFPAVSFPDGVEEAFSQLERKVQNTGDRVLFGISHGTKTGGITYKAAVKENFEGEARQLALDGFTIPKGTFLSTTVKNWKSNIEKMTAVFTNLLADPRLDTSCPCIEWYQGNDVVCMVKIK